MSRIDREQTFFPRPQVFLQLDLEFLDSLDRHRIEIAVLHRPHNRHLFLDRDRIVLHLLEQLDDALTAIEPRFGRGVEIGTELRERRELAELREVQLHFAGHLFDRLDLRGGTDTADRKTDRNRRPHALVEQIGLEINLAVGDRDDVRRNVSRHVAGLRLDDRQRRERTAAEFFGHARAAFEQTRMQIKDVARIRFASGRALENERDLPVSDRVFRKIVIYNERVHAVIHEPLAHGGAGERREILIRRRVRRGRGNDRRVRHRAFLLENGERAGDVGILLADRDVDAIERTIILRPPSSRRFVQTGLADDGVDRDCRFAGRAIADDQFALAAADRNHRVDRHDAGLHRLANASCA